MEKAAQSGSARPRPDWVTRRFALGGHRPPRNTNFHLLSLGKNLLPEFADLRPVYEDLLEHVDARSRRSVESAIGLLASAAKET